MEGLGTAAGEGGMYCGVWGDIRDIIAGEGAPGEGG